ncbi:MAG: tetratricopeptide repeat protein [Gallionellaceae bacterium]
MTKNSPDKWFQQALQHHQAGRMVDAVFAYRQVLELQPDNPQCHYNMALALQSLNQIDAAITGYRRAIGINGGFAEAHNNLGNIFHLQGRLEEASLAYIRALEINPRLAQAQFNLGLVLKKQSRFSMAAERFQAALAIAPDYVEALENLFLLLKQLGRIEEWLDVFRKYENLANKPEWFFVFGLSACRFLGDFESERKYLQALQAHTLKNGDIGVLDDLIGKIQYFDLPQAEILRLYQAYNETVKRQHFAEFPLVPPYRSQRPKLRIGYLSADFRIHVMGKLMLEVLSRHDRNQFELNLYSLALQEDELTAQFRNISDKFVTLYELPARQAAMKIGTDDLDILIDLCNHTIGANPPILAYKPARVQITHLGLHGAIGLDAVDYKMTDHYADLPENGAYLLEKLLPMEGCIFPFRHVEPDDNAQFSRAELGISDDAVVLGVFVNIMKLSPRCLQTWANIMQRVQRAVLAFSLLRDNEKPSVLRQITAAGIDPARVIFIPAAKDERFNRARYKLLDIALDTFPYSGGDTTLAALDMGVPVVTLCGQRHSERTSYSILMNLGVTETIAHSENEFAEIADRLANDADWRGSLVDKIQNAMTSSSLVDMDGYARRLEDAYRTAISRFQFKEGGSNDETRRLFQEAVRNHQANRLTEAETLYQQVLMNQADHAEALYLYGRLLAQAGSHNEAVEYLKRAIAVSPAYFDAHLALGNIFLKLGRMEDACNGFNLARQLKPENFDVLNGLGQALSRDGRLREAIAVLQQALERHPGQSLAYFNLGVAYHKQGDLHAAEAAYRHALMLDPDDTDIRSNLELLIQDRKQSALSRTTLNSKRGP